MAEVGKVSAITDTKALRGAGSAPILESSIKQLSRRTAVEWLFPDPYMCVSA